VCREAGESSASGGTDVRSRTHRENNNEKNKISLKGDFIFV
jgi:hypothetical protein